MPRKGLKALERASRRILFSVTSRMESAVPLPPAVPTGSSLNRILIMRQDRIGDMVMTLPLLRELRRLHPCARLCLVATPTGASVLRYEEGVEVIRLGKSPWAFLEALSGVAGFSPDAAVDMHMHDSTTSFLFASFSGALWSLHADGRRKLPFSVRVPVPRDGHIMEAFAALLSGLGKRVSPAQEDRSPRIGVEEEEFSSAFWQRSPAAPEECIGVNLSAGGDNRWWGAENYAALCGMLTAAGWRPLLLHAPDHAARASTVLEASPGALAAPAAPDILHVSALLRGLRLMVSPDTSVVHLAAAHGIPVVGLYLPFDPTLPKWHPWMVPSVVLTADRPCSLASIRPLSVFEQVEQLLERMELP
jgi:ADP-heptose:LPS heptosyltransferase